MKASLLALAASSLLATAAFGQTYLGNTSTGFGGAVGNGSLTFSTDGTTLTGTYTRGASGTFNDALVIYIDSASGGFSDTSAFGDNGDGLRSAISGFSGGTNRSALTFSTGFAPEYAIALDQNFAGLWQLAAGGSNSLPFVVSGNLSPTGTNSSATYTFTISLASIGIAPGQSFRFTTSYISLTAYRSNEAVGHAFPSGTADGGPNNGYNPVVLPANAFATFTAIPEPSTVALLGAGCLAGIAALRRRRTA